MSRAAWIVGVLAVACGGCKKKPKHAETDAAVAAPGPAAEVSVGDCREIVVATGYGTIGTGRYGTISMDLGTGRGFGGGKPRSGPRIKLEMPKLTGALDPNMVRRVLRQNQNRLSYCFEKELSARPGLKAGGSFTAKFTITAAGAVKGASVTGFDK